MPWAIVLGGVASAAGWTLPGPIDRTVAMLAGAASPVALFTIGAVLARSQMNSHERVAARDYVPIALAKLLGHPLLVWTDRKSTRLNSSHLVISYAVFCLKNNK